MTGQVIAGIEFQQDAFRLECQWGPQLSEMEAYHRFLDGDPLLPSSWPEWQGWLNRVQEMTTHATISRVILLDERPTLYQLWRVWGAPWHRQAGENLLFMPYREARNIGIPVGNWWLFDNEQLVEGYEPPVTGPAVDAYRRGRDLALRHATAGETLVVA